MSALPQRPVQQKPPKEPPDPAHLSNVAMLPCMVCSRASGPPHHLLRVPGGTRGTGRRNHDKWAVPLCQKHHDPQIAGSVHHDGNEVRWFKSHGIDYQVELAQGLWVARDKFGLMMEVTRVMKARMT